MEKTWRTEIGGKPTLFNIDFKEIWQYRSLIIMLFKRNYSVQYKQTILGPLWMLFGVVFNTGLLTFVFGYVGKLSSDGVPYFLFCMTGNIIWSLFSTCFGANTKVLIENSYMFGKVYFPRLIVPLSNSLLCIVRCMLQFLVCIFVWAVTVWRFGYQVKWERLLGIIPLLLLASAMGTAMGLIICSLTVKYRDFDHLTGLIISGLMYVSPVLYPSSQLSPTIRRFVYFNPMSSFIEGFRYCLSETDSVYVPGLVYSIVFTAMVVFLALIMYGKAEKNFIDIV
jgi:lipopolysaccharide transport system permease protein